MNKRIALETCPICGNPLKTQYPQTGYIFFTDGKSQTGIPFCSSKCADKFIKDYGSPLFESQEAMELFKEKHPIKWNRIRGKPKLFLQKEF